MNNIHRGEKRLAHLAHFGEPVQQAEEVRPSMHAGRCSKPFWIYLGYERVTQSPQKGNELVLEFCPLIEQISRVEEVNEMEDDGAVVTTSDIHEDGLVHLISGVLEPA